MKPYKMALPKNMEERQAMSRRVQEHAFEMGRRWIQGGIVPQCLRHPFLLFYESGHIYACSYKEIFEDDEGEEITPEAFLALPIPGADFMSDFEDGLCVVGKFWDDDEKPAIGILSTVRIEKSIVKSETIIYATSLTWYKNFEYLKTFDNPAEAEKFILGRLGI